MNRQQTPAPPPLQTSPRFCGQCGAALPSPAARFCVECGHPVRTPAAEPPEPPQETPAATGPTVRLANARGEQSVVGGTVRLPSSGATPPGLWFAPKLPAEADIIAIYAPMRAVVGGWSGAIGDGWRKTGQAWAGDATSRERVSFVIEREWFAAPGGANAMRLRVQIRATSLADEGRTRRGFRYRIGADPPMEVAATWWIDSDRQPRLELPVPQIQIMAPPRVRRVSDYIESIGRMNDREAAIWSGAGVVTGLFRLPNTAQQRTPVGRGLPLLEHGGMLQALTRRTRRLYRVQIHRPLICRAGDWEQLHPRIQADARGLGLDMETDAVVEWWLDRQGYDGAIFERGAHNAGRQRMVVAFRRAQIVEVQG